MELGGGGRISRQRHQEGGPTSYCMHPEGLWLRRRIVDMYKQNSLIYFW